jgi:hypothetical protein
MTVTSGTHLNKQEVAEQVALIGHAVSDAFIKVCEREEAEKHILVGLSEKRLASNNNLTNALKAEMASAEEQKKIVKQAEKTNRK